MSDSNQSGSSFSQGLFIGALIGAAAGAIAALLLTPKTGAEMRKELAERSGEYYNKATDYLSKVEETVAANVQKAVNEGKDKAQRIITNAKKQADEILYDAENLLHEAKSKASSGKESVQNKFGTIKDATKAGVDAFKSEMKA